MRIIKEAVRHPDTYKIISPSIGECEVCKRHIELEGFTNTCTKCGADYNWAGQRLASREQWGEDTGEHLSDILRIK